MNNKLKFNDTGFIFYNKKEPYADFLIKVGLIINKEDFL
jgi:hypothetical protein